MSKLSRRQVLRFAAVGSAAMLAACQPKVVEKVVKETVVVTEEKLVKETVVVKEAVEVEKEVTRVVEKQVKASEGPVTLVVQHLHAHYYPWAEEMLDPAFEEAYPNVKVKREFTAGYTGKLYPKLIAMHVAGTAWDVAHCPSRAGAEYTLAGKGVIKSLDPFVEAKGYDLGQYIDVAVEGGRYPRPGGTLWFLPIYLGPGLMVMFYNKTLFEQAGVDTPNKDWQYEVEFLDALTKLNDTFGDEDILSWVPPVTGMLWHHLTIVNAWGGSVIDDTGRNVLYDQSPAIDGLRWHHQLFEQGLVTSPEMATAGNDEMLGAGKLAFHVTWMPHMTVSSEVAEKGGVDWGATIFPKGPGSAGKHGEVANTHYIAISSDTKHADAAWDYITFFNSAETAAMRWEGLGHMTARVDDWNNPRFMDAFDVYGECSKVLPSMPLYPVPWNLRGAEAEAALVAEMDGAWLGQTAFDDAIQAGTEEMRKVLDKGMSS